MVHGLLCEVQCTIDLPTFDLSLLTGRNQNIWSAARGGGGGGGGGGLRALMYV